MKLAVLCIFLTLALTSCKEENATETMPVCSETFSFYESKINIILIIGQSNTHSGLGLDKDIDTTTEGVFQLGRFGSRNFQIIRAIEPLEHHTARPDKIGFGLTFANLFKEKLLKSNDSLIIIPCGFGATGFSNNMWNKGDTLYNDAVTRVKYLLDRYPQSKLQAILWHQGEYDVDNNAYEDLLKAFILDIRKDLGDPKVPFLLGGMVPYWVNQSQSRINQQNIIASIKKQLCVIGYADPSYPFVIEKDNNSIEENHFDAAGQREMGLRYFNEYLKLKEEN